MTFFIPKSFVSEKEEENRNMLVIITKRDCQLRVRIRFMVFNATLNNISALSWQSVLLMEQTGVPGENHRPVASH